MTDPRFPIGKFAYSGPLTSQQKQQYLDSIEHTPALMRAAVAGLSDQQLDTPYRDGGWTVRQVVHHVPDSHVNSYVRFKLALTEDHPTIQRRTLGGIVGSKKRAHRVLAGVSRASSRALDSHAARSVRCRLEANLLPS